MSRDSPRMRPRKILRSLRIFQAAKEVQGVFDLAHERPRYPAATVEGAEVHQVLEVLALAEPGPRPVAQGPVMVRMSVHVMLDQERGALGDRPFQGLESRGDMVRRVDRLADVVEEG